MLGLCVCTGKWRIPMSTRHDEKKTDLLCGGCVPSQVSANHEILSHKSLWNLRLFAMEILQFELLNPCVKKKWKIVFSMQETQGLFSAYIAFAQFCSKPALKLTSI